MDITGRIRFQKRVQVRRKECYGKCATWGNHFLIAISRVTFCDFSLFAETILHEILHMGLGLIASMSNSDISETNQHKIMQPALRTIMKGIKKYRVKENS